MAHAHKNTGRHEGWSIDLDVAKQYNSHRSDCNQSQLWNWSISVRSLWKFLDNFEIFNRLYYTYLLARNYFMDKERWNIYVRKWVLYKVFFPASTLKWCFNLVNIDWKSIFCLKNMSIWVMLRNLTIYICTLLENEYGPLTK